MTDEEMEEIQSRVGDYDMFVGGLSIASDDVTLVGIRRRTA